MHVFKTESARNEHWRLSVEPEFLPATSALFGTDPSRPRASCQFEVHNLPGPQVRGTGGTFIVVWKGNRDSARLPIDEVYRGAAIVDGCMREVRWCELGQIGSWDRFLSSLRRGDRWFGLMLTP